jgi:ankyrin repeat protein
MVEFLLANEANCNIKDKRERTSLHWASYIGNNDIIRLLISHGAEINSMDKEVIILFY